MEKSIHIPLESLVVPPLAVRVKVDEEKILELAETVKEHGVIEPLVVRPSKAEAGKYEVVCGLRRFLAAQKAGLPDVPCIVKEMSDLEAMEAMLVENLQREDLTDYEVGRWFKLLMERFPDKYPNLQTVAKRFNYKSHAQVSQLISHYEFVENIKQRLPSNIVTRVTMLPEFMIREIRRATPEDLQVKLVKAVCIEFERFERGEIKFAPSARDVAKLVDSFTLDWERELKAKEEEREAEKAKPEKPEKPEKAEAPSKLEVEEAEFPAVPTSAPEKMEKPKPPSKPEAPSEAEVGARLEEVMRKRREEEQRKREEAMVVTLYKYYPENLIKDVESFFGEGAPLDKIQKLAYYTIDVAWQKLPAETKMEIIREARSWMD